MYNAKRAKYQTLKYRKHNWFKLSNLLSILYCNIVCKIILFRILLRIRYVSIFKGKLELKLYSDEYYNYGHIIPLKFRKIDTYGLYIINNKTVSSIYYALVVKRGFKCIVKRQPFYKGLYMIVEWI